MSTKKPQNSKERKIFLNCMNSWLSNFIIEEFRTDYLPDAKIKNVFMGTLDLTGRPLPALFEPKEITIEVGYNYNQEVFQNDIFIYNLDDSNLSEVEFIIRGLQTIKYDNQKILILISNIMTWANTPLKTFTNEEINKEGFDEEEVIEIEEQDETKKETNEINEEEEVENNEEDKKSELSKESKETKKSKINKLSSKKIMKKIEDDKNNESKDNKDKDKDIKEKENSSNIKSEQSLDNQSNNQKEEVKEHSIKKEEENKIKIFYYKETEYEKRIPNSKYFYYKILESLALSNNNPNLKTYVICPGFIYGCGEDIFFEYFRASWLKNIEYMPIIGDGKNHIPTIHILDLVHLIKRVIALKPENNYIFACDRTKNPTLKNIISSISKGIGGIDIKIIKDFDVNEINLPHYTELNVDINNKLSSIMEDEPRRQNEDLEDYDERKFQWHCEFGIPENIDILRDEFNLYRDLRPAKIIIHSPPYSGKSTIAKIISEKYKLSHLTIDKICEWAKNEKNLLGDEVRQKNEEMEENISKAMEEYEHRKNKKKTDPPFDPAQYKKYPNDLLGKIIKSKLSEGECVGKGYILENFPKNFEDCINIFSNTPYDKEKKDEEINYEIKKDLLPESVIFINNYTEESLKNKLKIKYPDYAERQNELDGKFNRRLNNYKHYEEINEDNKKLLIDFYKENNVDIFFIDESKFNENNEIDNNKIFEFIERNGSIDNEYKLFDEEEIKIFEIINEKIKNEEKSEKKEEKSEKVENFSENQNISDNQNLSENKEKTNSKNNENDIKEEENINSKQIDEKEEESKKKSNINESVSEKNEDKKISNIEISKVDENEKIQQKLREIKEREMNLLEKKSEILRRYLSENVMPLLAKGVLNICQNMPDDPVEALANYLMDNSLNLSKVNTNNNKTENELEKIIDESIN